MTAILPNQQARFLFIGGPHDGQTLSIPVHKLRFYDGPFEYRLTLIPQPDDEQPPFIYALVSAKQHEAAIEGIVKRKARDMELKGVIEGDKGK
jgi:hypothetical protein